MGMLDRLFGKKKMQPAEAEARLRRLLAEANYDFDHPDPQTAWAIFKAFVREPVACSDDGVLFQCSVHSLWTGTEQFYFDLVRQFGIDVDGEYDHMEQLHCLLSCPPTEAARRLNTNLWLEQCGNDYDAFFKAVEAKPEFQTAVRFTGWTCEVLKHEV